MSEPMQILYFSEIPNIERSSPIERKYVRLEDAQFALAVERKARATAERERDEATQKERNRRQNVHADFQRVLVARTERRAKLTALEAQTATPASVQEVAKEIMEYVGVENLHEMYYRHVESILTRYKDAEVVALREQLEASRADTKRLDFVLSPSKSFGVVEVDSVKGSAVWWFTREAIDAAMQPAPDGEVRG